jgi:hypothetical protein
VAVVRPYFVPFPFLSPDEWCLVVTIKEIYLGLGLHPSRSLLVISTIPSAKCRHACAGVKFVLQLTNYFSSYHLIEWIN